MSNSINSGKAIDLVQFFSTISSTEDLIIYVAGTEGMLIFCRSILEEFDQNSSSENVQQMNLVCKSQGVLLGLFYSELRKVLLALNTFHDQDRNHYETLGLQSDASLVEVKKAYRQLSMRYHPDKSEQGDNQADRFMEISGAYHAILIHNSNGGNSQHVAETPWRDMPDRKHSKQPRGKGRFFFALTALIGVLVLVSLYLADRFNDNALRQHPLNSGAASSARQDTPAEKISDTPAVSEILSAPPVARMDTADLREDDRGDQDSSLPVVDGLESGPENDVISQKPGSIHPRNNVIYPISSNSNEADQEADPASLPRQNNAPREQPIQTVDVEITEQSSMVSNPPRSQINEKQSNKIEAFNREVKIGFLLKQYTKLYNRKELDTYLELFTDAATENGNPLTAEVGKYKQLFAATETIDLRLHDINWQEQQDGFQAKGTFTGSYTYKSGDQQLHKGNIIFQLRDEQGTMKIESLVYFFKE